MVAEKRLRELAAQKRLLVLQSDLHRKLIAVEYQDFVSAAGWKSRSNHCARSVNWLGLIAAPLAGLVLAQKWRRVFQWLSCGISAWRFLQPFIKK